MYTGATIGCMKHNCRRQFHLKCALLCQCTLLEARQNTETADSPHEIYTLMACPEHFRRIDTTKLYRKWTPTDPQRFLSVLESEDIESERLSDQLAQGYDATAAADDGDDGVSY
jgi:hypothetical protein